MRVNLPLSPRWLLLSKSAGCQTQDGQISPVSLCLSRAKVPNLQMKQHSLSPTLIFGRSDFSQQHSINRNKHRDLSVILVDAANGRLGA
jgi:hypothetical protein